MTDAIRKTFADKDYLLREKSRELGEAALPVLKKLTDVPTRTWFWIHKGLFAVYALLIFFNLPTQNEELEECSLWYMFGMDGTGIASFEEAKDALGRIIRVGRVEFILLVLIFFVTAIYTAALWKRLSSAGKKKNIFKNRRTVIDIILNILAALMLVHSTSAVNYVFLSADRNDCTYFSKAVLYRDMKKDIRRGETERLIIPISEASVERNGFSYREADISPYVWGLPLPFGNELTVWFVNEKESYNTRKPIGVYMDLGKPKMAYIPLYSLNAGGEKYPLSEWNYKCLADQFSLKNYDNNATLEITRYKRSHLIEDIKIKK